MDGQAKSIRELFLQYCAGSEPACEALFQELRPVFKRIAMRLAFQFNSSDDAEDLVQDICMKVMATHLSLAEALPQESAAVQAYFSVLAANVVRDRFRNRFADKRGAKLTVSIEAMSRQLSAEYGWNSNLDRDLLLSQIEAALPSTGRERIIFRLYYRQGFSAKEIASIPAVKLNTKGVESVILRLSRQLKERLNPPEGKAAGGAS